MIASLSRILTAGAKSAVFAISGLLAVSAFGDPPVRIAGYGPNGSHWPRLIPTPFLYDATANDITVDCSWAAINNALSGLTQAQADAGVRILVKPGSLTGQGASSVLSGLGSSTWQRRVTVCPRDGYGSVKILGSFKFTKVKGVCFAGFYCTGGFYLLDCDRSALAWSRVNGYSTLQAQTTGTTVSNIELCELVWPQAMTSNADVLQLASNTGLLTGFSLEGLWMAPHYYVDDTEPRPHTDTLQVYATGAGRYQDMNLTLRDSVIFGSNNAAIQTGGIDGLFMDHVLIAGGHLGKQIYPVTPGGEDEEFFCPLNGAGSNWTVKDSLFFGPMQLSNPSGRFSDQPFKSVVRGTRSMTGGLTQPQSGAWVLDSSLASYTRYLSSLPDDNFMESLWGSGRLITPPPASADSLVATVGSGWHNMSLLPSTGNFEVSFDMVAGYNAIDCVTGLSTAAASGFEDLAVAVRFTPAGLIDARDGGEYRAENPLEYQPDLLYRVVLEVDVDKHVYSATVTPEGGSAVVIASDYAFRTDQAAATQLGNLAAVAIIGFHSVSEVRLNSKLVKPPGQPGGLRPVGPATN